MRIAIINMIIGIGMSVWFYPTPAKVQPARPSMRLQPHQP
jgi:hypothetical protein